MGLDLTLLPIDVLSSMGSFSHTILPLNRYTELFEDIGDAAMRGDGNARTVPENFHTYLSNAEGEACYGVTVKTPYGDPLLMIRREILLGFTDHVGVRSTARNRAAWAYLAALPPETWIALYFY